MILKKANDVNILKNSQSSDDKIARVSFGLKQACKTQQMRHIQWLQNWPPGGATSIGCKIGHQVAPLAIATHLTWCRCIGCKYGHQVAPLVLLQMWPTGGASWIAIIL